MHTPLYRHENDQENKVAISDSKNLGDEMDPKMGIKPYSKLL